MSVKSLLAATAAGVALGMLMAPEKGTDTQKKIGESLDKLKKIGRASGRERVCYAV